MVILYTEYGPFDITAMGFFYRESSFAPYRWVSSETLIPTDKFYLKQKGMGVRVNYGGGERDDRDWQVFNVDTPMEALRHMVINQIRDIVLNYSDPLQPVAESHILEDCIEVLKAYDDAINSYWNK